MSIIRAVLRLATVAALRQRTVAEERVYDSSNTPLVHALEVDGPEKPYVVVFTDNDNRLDVEGRNVMHSRRNIHLVMEIGVASKVEGKNNTVDINIPCTEAGYEMSLDIMEYQIANALFHDAKSDFGEIVRRIVLDVERAPSLRGAGSQRGTKWAARQFTFVVNTIDDVEAGVPLYGSHPVVDFIALARANPELGMTEQADVIELLIGGVTYTDWEQLQGKLATTRQGIAAIGLAPFNGVVNLADQPYLLSSVSVQQDGDGSTLIESEEEETP